jgi:hypothetical protein
MTCKAFTVVILAVLICSLALYYWLNRESTSIDKVSNPSIIYSGGFGSPNVENGLVYDYTVLSVDENDILSIPEQATVTHHSVQNTVFIYMEKQLQFRGWPPECIRLTSLRKYVGCASRRNGKNVTLATFGEWDSGRDGGCKMSLIVQVPHNVVVSPAIGLSGTDSIAQRPIGNYLRKAENSSEGFWYGHTEPDEGWTRLISYPDIQQIGKKMGSRKP